MHYRNRNRSSDTRKGDYAVVRYPVLIPERLGEYVPNRIGVEDQ